MILYHAITCDEDDCDPPRTVDNAPRLPVVLEGCPIGDPQMRGPVRVLHQWDVGAMTARVLASAEAAVMDLGGGCTAVLYAPTGR